MAIPLAQVADHWLARFAVSAHSSRLAELNGATLLGERAMLNGLSIPGRISAGGGCRLYPAMGDTVALNLSRPTDRELLPALFETQDFDAACRPSAIGTSIAARDARRLVARGRIMGLAISAMREPRRPMASPCRELVAGHQSNASRMRAPRVVDLSALWAGPLAAHLLWLGGAEVIKVESLHRPDGMRRGSSDFYSLLNQGKSSVALDFSAAADRAALVALIAASDIVIEAARPRALLQLGIDAADLVRHIPGLVWITVTGHGAEGDASGWVGFGDDCGVAGGLSQALFDATGCIGFLGDAIADPLTGIAAAQVAWQAWEKGCGGRFGLAMSDVAAHSMALAQEQDPEGLALELRSWAMTRGRPFPQVDRRPIGPVAAFGEQTQSYVGIFKRKRRYLSLAAGGRQG